MSYFWTVKVQPLRLLISQQTWVERVLPGLGYDRLRLVEVRLPPELPEHGSAAVEFDRAKQAWDQRRYTDCVVACRGLVKIWTATLGAAKANPLGRIVGDQRRWKQDDPRRALLTDTWNSLIGVVNTAHHPESNPVDPLEFGAADARLVFLMVSVLSEYLGAVA